MNNTTNQLDLMNRYRTLHPTTAEYTSFLNVYGTSSKIDNILGHKMNLNKFMKIEIIQNIFPNHNGKKLEINNRSGKFTYVLKLNHTLKK